MIEAYFTKEWKPLDTSADFEDGTYFLQIVDDTTKSLYSGLVSFITGEDYQMQEILLNAQIPKKATRLYFAIKGNVIYGCLNGKPEKHNVHIRYKNVVDTF